MDPHGALYLQIADTLAQSIRAGTLARGERMPSVRDLARRHGVSVSTAVQAYRSLEDAQLIEARPRSGYFVAARPPRLPEPEVSRPPERSLPVDLGEVAAHMIRVGHDPQYISFGAACPSADLFDNDRVRRTVSRAIQRNRALLTHYPVGPGQEALRRVIARQALRLGCPLDPSRILVSNGCLESITLALRAATEPGDIVALNRPRISASWRFSKTCACARSRFRPIRAPACRWTRCSWRWTPSPCARCSQCRRCRTRWARACRRPNAGGSRS